ncbi:MAG: M48 family metallopeptidase [Prevotella sp.]|nr:M48 family metallopeptidase [Prevotella sp.]
MLLGMIWIFLALTDYFLGGVYNEYGEVVRSLDADTVNYYFLEALPWVVGGVAIWFCIAYFTNASMVKASVNAHSLERRDNPRVYNIVENLCMSCGMDMPRINIVDDPQLNAFASGINRSSYTVTVTTGLLLLLDDDELAGVIGHELTHIRNKDTRLLITSIIFVGIISAIMSLVVRTMYYTFLFGGAGRSRGSDRKNGGAGVVVVFFIGIICCIIAYIFTLITRFAISRRREYMADAGGSELCGNPLALASALRKISRNPGLGNVKRADVAQLFIMRPDVTSSGIMGFMDSLFSTHPDPEKRIRILEQF